MADLNLPRQTHQELPMRFVTPPSRHRRWIFGVVAFAACLMNPRIRADQAGDRFFRERIEPVLKAKCYECHSADSGTIEAGLRLDSRKAMLVGGDSGPVVDLKNVANSLLLQAIRHESGLEMPPDEPKLAANVVADVAKWIEMGIPNTTPETEPKMASNDARKHWAFQAIRKPGIPDVGSTRQARMPVDAFVSAKLARRGWRLAEAAEPGVLIRRVYFDLVGLPPTPEEVQAFVDDKSPDAYEQLVDRLLASPRYGERWAQHWLDVVRFAETEGFEYDRHLPDAWRFRDYVISAFNSDKPFDRFVSEQIAGDEIDEDDSECQTAAIFHRLGAVRRNAGNPDIALSRNEVLTERTNIIGEAFLGLTVGCARCHNHKLEPISQQDYYRLQAYFAATKENNLSLIGGDQKKAWDRKTKSLKDRIAKLKQRLVDADGDVERRLRDEIAELEASLPPHLPTIPGIRNDFENRTPIHVLRRGVWEHKGLAVGPRPLEVLLSVETDELPPNVSQPRTHLAAWLTSAKNPLTARVIVNRIWQYHFGVGLVKTANDFGTHGDAPSHPKLLDYLSATFVEGGWRIKPLHRRILLSDVYRQSSRSPSETAYSKDDPENRLLWKFNRRRLSAEEIRDTMLTAAGRLNLEAGGASVIVPVDEELVGLLYKPEQWRVSPDTAQHHRRSIYLIAKRNLRLPFMETFDAPTLQSSCARRDASTHAPQALELLNGEFANQMSRAFAERLRRECGADHQQIVARAFWLAVGRQPNARERELSLRFLDQYPIEEFALAILNLNEVVYVQ